MLEGIPHFDVTVHNETVDCDVKTFISHVKKSWDVNKLTKKVFNGGYINTLVGYYVKTDDGEENDNSDIFILKIYGVNSDASVDRLQELKSFKELSCNHVAPELYCTFTNGFCYEYVHGKVCNQDDFKDFEISKLSADCMARLHSVKLSDSYKTTYSVTDLFQFISDHIRQIPQKFKNSDNQIRFTSQFSSERLYDELNKTKEMCPQLSEECIVMCHNDLNIPNLIYNEKEQIMHCIDYEFAGPNYAAYDIANHFTEFAGNSGTVDFDLVPNESTQKQWIRKYLLKFNQLNKVSAAITDQDIDTLYEKIKYFILVSHLVWGIWGFVQAETSAVDFDFMDYSILRMKAYFKHKKMFF